MENINETYQRALTEFENNRIEAVWVRAQIESEDDAEKARLRYIQIRVDELQRSDEVEITAVNEEAAIEPETEDSQGAAISGEDEVHEKLRSKQTDQEGWIHIKHKDAEYFKYYGIGGWANILVISIFFGPVLGAAKFLKDPPDPFLLSTIKGAELLWYLENIFVYGNIIVSWILLYALGTQKRWFQKTFIVWVCVWLAFNGLDLLAVSSLTSVPIHQLIGPQEISAFVGSAISSIIWAFYVLKSKRINIYTRFRIKQSWIDDASLPQTK